MALIKVGGLITDIRGKLGGVCFQNSSSGLMVRTNTKSKNRNTNTQNIQRNILATTQTGWRELSDSNREKYNKLSKFAQLKQKNISKRGISGQQLYIKVNSLLIRYGLSTISNTRFNQQELQPLTITIENDANRLYVNTSRNISFNKEVLILYCSSSVSSSINKSRNRKKLIVFTQSGTNQFAIQDSYMSIFGAIPETGDSIFVKYFLVGKRCALLGTAINDKIEVI